MSKRAVSVYFVFCLVMGFLVLQLASIGMGGYASSATQNNSMTVEVSRLRGGIYDYKGRLLVNTDYDYIAAAKPSASALEALRPFLDEQTLNALTERMQKGYPVTTKVYTEEIRNEDVLVVRAKKRYGTAQIAAHLIGYCDAQGEGVAGLEKSYNALLGSSTQSKTICFAADANGRILTGSAIEIRETGDSTAGVQVTIDRDIQRIAEESLDVCGIDKGAVVVLDVKTGAIRAMASRPTFSANSLADSLHNPNAPLINRALLGYAVGSVFKPAVAAAALEQGFSPSSTYTCTGSIQIGNMVFRCHNEEGHGVVNMKAALANSCNPYFVHLAMQLEIENLLAMAASLGYGNGTQLTGTISGAAGTLPAAADISSPGAVANLSFGQGSLLATPLQVAASFAAIANDGWRCEPYLVQGFVDKDGRLYDETPPAAPERVMADGTAKQIQEFMVETVTNGSGKNAAPANGSAGGKTATAQTGTYDENGVERNIVWFAGFFPAENPQYAVAVMKEDGSAGGADCAPVFKLIADGVLDGTAAVSP